MLLAVLGTVFSCQRVELPEEKPAESSGDKVFGEATITFSTLLPSSPQTKAMGDDPFGEGDNPDDIKSLYLVIFDANGMLVESRPAKIISQQKHGDHLYESEYSVTITMSDQPRIIHFIANCPTDQIVYGHETSIIGNMYVEKDKDPGTPETAYWARITVDNLIIAAADTENPYFADKDVEDSFKCVPLLRNFAQISVLHDQEIKAPEGVNFEYLGFAVYNTVDMGTVAPYNNKVPYTFETGKFQSFLEPDGQKTYSYPDFLEMEYPYEGHALAAADLNQSLEIADPSSNDDAIKYRWYGPEESYFMYERKISVKTDDEALWNESPPHLIIKARYNGKICYYKVDLVYKKDDREIKYYNILRNFRYQFTIKSVEHEGYSTVLEAVNGATSNNLAGSSTTSNFTNISDSEGRLWVSYTEKLLVTGDPITFYYRYQPDIDNSNYNNKLTTEDGGLISFEDPDGEQIDGGSVIESFAVGEEITEGEWAGYRKIYLEINEPDVDGDVMEQSFILRTDKATLAREVRFTLRNKYDMEVECTPAVLPQIGQTLQLDIKLPGGLTASMFPLALRIEVENTSLSPDASKNTIPVEVGKSTIPGKIGQPTFYYVKTIQTKAEYDNLPTDGTSKVVTTDWITNIAKSASNIYVSNQYFNDGHDNFLNGVIFTGVKVVTPADRIFYGAGETASITFTMSNDDTQYNQKDVTVTLNGLENQDGNTVFTVRPDGNRTVTINNLETTSLDDEISFTVSHPEYISVTSDPVIRYQGIFTDLKIGGDGEAVPKGVDLETNVSFMLDAADNNWSNRQITVQFVGLVDGEGNRSKTIVPTGREVVIDNLYTETAEGNIRIIVTEQDGEYAEAVANFTRRDRKFQNLDFDGKESLGSNAGEHVDFTFEIPESEYVDGMTVNVKLVGLAPRDGETTLSPVTRATNYTYTPDSYGTQTFYLQTTDEDVDEYVVRLSADGFENAEGTLTQSDIQNGRIPRDRTISGTLENVPNNPNGQNNRDFIISIDGNASKTFKANITRTNIGTRWDPIYEYTYTVTINTNWDIQYTDPNQPVTVTVTFQNNQYSGTCTVEQIINGNITGMELSL